MLIGSRIGKRLAILALVASAGMMTACIFDEGGDYTGGGRRDTGAKLNQGDDNTQTDQDGGGGGGKTDSGGSPFSTDSGGGGG